MKLHASELRLINRRDCRLVHHSQRSDSRTTHIHALAEGGGLVMCRLPDAGVHDEDDQVLAQQETQNQLLQTDRMRLARCQTSTQSFNMPCLKMAVKLNRLCTLTGATAGTPDIHIVTTKHSRK